MKVRRVIQRETDAVERGRPLMIAVGPRDLIVWLKGTRERYAISYQGIFWAAAKIAANERRKEK